MRVTDDVLDEIIENDGCRRGSVSPINSTGVVRLALDLQDARNRIAELEMILSSSSRMLESAGSYLASRVPTKPTRKRAAKRTKKEVT